MKELPKRKPNRLPLFDYGGNGVYFLTLCTHDKQNLFRKSCRDNDITMGTLWQRSYYDHIIRNEIDFLTKWDYIENNIAQWTKYEYY